MKIEPGRMLERLDGHIAAVGSERHRQLLRTVKAHVSAELDARDVERVMRTMVPEPQFRWWGMGYGDVGPKGREAVAAHYRQMLGGGYHLHEHVWDRVIVDDRHVVLEGPIHIAFPGTVLAAMGIEIDDPDAHYLLSYQSCAIFHFDEEGRCTGEDAYSDGNPVMPDRLQKLAPQDVPDPVVA